MPPKTNAIRRALARLRDALVPTEIYERPAKSVELPAIGHTVTASLLHGILREAEQGDTRRLFSLYRDIILSDPHILTEFSKRKLAVLGDAMNVSPFDADDPDDVTTADFIRDELADLSGKREALTHLLDASLYPVALVEKRYRPTERDGARYTLLDLVPVPHHLLDFSAEDGCLRVRDLDPVSRQPLGTFHRVTPGRYIVHRGHLLTSCPDRWGGPMRAALFWWLFKTQDRAWWGRFLERFGAPFIVGHYNTADQKSRRELEGAFSEATRIFGLVIPTDARVEMVQANSAQGGDAFEQFHRIANAELSKLIVGQTMTTDAAPGGIGGSQAQVHERVRGDIRDFDAMALGDTLRDQLFRQVATINALPGRAPVLSWGDVDTSEAQLSGAFLDGITKAGLRVTDDGVEILGRRTGIPLERAPVSIAPAVSAFSATLLESDRPEVDAVAAAASENLAPALRGVAAGVRRAILESTGPDDLRRRLAALHADIPLDALETIIELALTAQASNAIART